MLLIVGQPVKCSEYSDVNPGIWLVENVMKVMKIYFANTAVVLGLLPVKICVSSQPSDT